MTNYLDDFRMNIKYYREKLEISQAELSIICDCGTGTIGGIESGKAKPSFDMMIKIAEALKVTPADLFIRDISKTKAEIKKEIKNQVEIMLAKIQFLLAKAWSPVVLEQIFCERMSVSEGRKAVL